MFSSKEKKLEALRKVFQKLVKQSEKTVIIVEGKKDRSSLRTFGIKGIIVCVKNSSKTLSDFLDQIQTKKVILLVDFDNQGAELVENITQYLEEKKVRVNSVYWKKLKALVGRDVKDIEGIPSYLEKLKKSAGVLT